MFQNNLKLAFRNLLKNKTQSSILIVGLTIGMAACMLLLQYVNFELSFDDFHQKQSNIYRIVNERIQNGETVQKGTITYPTIGPTMREEFPEVKNFTRMYYSSDVMIVRDNEVEPVEPGLWVDEHFFELFDFKILASEGLQLLNETNQLVLTQDLADRYFPAAKGNYEKVIGQEMRIDRDPDVYKIVGVCENVPANSSIQFEMLGSYASCIRYMGEGADNSWTFSDFYHFIELASETDVAALEAKFTDFSERHFRGTEVSGSKEIFTLQPFADAHLYSADLEYEIGRTANGQAVWSLLIIAFFILVIAWINYVNLSSVRAIERAKEVGVRKVLGANRGQLIRQFLAEALAVNTFSLLLAVGLVQIVSPFFATHFGLSPENLSLFSSQNVGNYLWLALFGLIVLGVLVSGIYPALLLSSSQMTSVLKGVFAKKAGGGYLRKGLVVFQFTMSIALIITTTLVSNQIQYMSQQDLGFDASQIMVVNSPEMTGFDSTFIDKMDALKAELAKFSTINKAATSGRVPGERMGRIFDLRKSAEKNTEQTYTTNFIFTDFEFAETYGLTPKAGRFFRQQDHNINGSLIDKIVINEAMVRMLGFATNEAAVQEKLFFNNRDYTIVGVLPDFHQRSLHHQIEPILFAPFYSTFNALSLNITTQNISETLLNVKQTYAEFFPGNTFDYYFLDESFQQLYESEQRFGSILSFFTLLTILIACLGLFGLAAYTTFLRTKEIGVRKVLGASAVSIVALLSKDFLRLVFIALVLAIPLAWWTMNYWLQDFAYRVEMQWWVFVVAGVGAIGIAFLTVSYQSIKAAVANPIQSLKTE
ncbi:MAG: ABC transporter permease [Bacteroidota bacterium]